jgi:hypothetical protein
MLKKRDGRLKLVNPTEALIDLMSKWIIAAYKPGAPNFKIMLRYRFVNYQPYSQGNWEPSLFWFTFRHYSSKAGSKMWNRTATSWKQLVLNIVVSSP